MRTIFQVTQNNVKFVIQYIKVECYGGLAVRDKASFHEAAGHNTILPRWTVGASYFGGH